MHPALKPRAEERQRAINLAKAYVERVQERLGPLTCVLFGSHARGDFNLGGDIDVLILSHALPKAPLDRLGLLYEYVGGRIDPKGIRRRTSSITYNGGIPSPWMPLSTA